MPWKLLRDYWRLLRNSQLDLRNSNSKLLATKHALLVSCVLTSFWLIPSVVYFLLIRAVIAQPEVMTSLGLEPFVDYVIYDFQFEDYVNLVQLHSVEPEFAMSLFYIHAASMLIVGAFLVIVSVGMLALPMFFPNVIYEMSRGFYGKGGRRSKILRLCIFLFLVVFFPTLYDLYIRGPEHTFIHKGVYGRSIQPPYGGVFAWLSVFSMHFIIMFALCMPIISKFQRTHGKLSDDSSS